MQINRRDFMVAAAFGTAAMWKFKGQPQQRLLIQAMPDDTFLRMLARKELLRGLIGLRIPVEVRFSGAEEQARSGDLVCVMRIEPPQFKSPEAYSIAMMGSELTFTGASERALLYSVFDFLERQGTFFGLDGENYPLDIPAALNVPHLDNPWMASPRFVVRGLLPWPDFLNCISVFNSEDFRAYFESMLRMRFNTFGMHVYTGAEQWAESYLSFEYGGVGHLAYLDNSASNRWGYLPQRTSRYAMGAPQFYDSEVFGSDATRLAKDPWETAERTRDLLRGAFDYAKRLGIRTGIGFEPYQIPDEILRALPPEAKPAPDPARPKSAPRFDIESVAAHKLLEGRLAQLLEAYPEVEYVWLWEDEAMNWESRRTGVPLSTTPFQQAYDFLKRHAPNKRLVCSGWGGVARHFEYFHQKLPGNVIFSCLNDSLGWDPVDEVFARLEGRERWPIPWLEDDPSMWLPQFHVHRTERDVNLAEQYGCQGLLGIHWRHRITAPTASYQAKSSWDKLLTPAEHFRTYAKTQVAGDRVSPLAELMTAMDKEQKLLGSTTNEVKDGHVVYHQFAGDYDEGFVYWSDYEPTPLVVASQKDVASSLRAIAGKAQSATEQERIEYLTQHVEFAVSYTDAWINAHHIDKVLQQASELKKARKVDAARQLIANDAVPTWLRMAPEVRRAMLHFQNIVATRSDLGTLASLQNKFVRLALIRLRLSLQEYLNELPAETEALYRELVAPDPSAPLRLFIPTNPSMLWNGEQVRVMIIVTGSGPIDKVTVHYQLHGSAEWKDVPAELLGRRTYQAYIGPFSIPQPLVRYFASASVGNGAAVWPPEAPEGSRMITLT